MNDARCVIAFLTGQSARGRTALSAEQRVFLAELPGAESSVVKLEVNFPYAPDALPYHWPSLPIASWNNFAQYWRSRRPAFAARYREQVIAALMPYERVVLLAGSCGLELLMNLRLPEELLSKTHVFAYGPVARSAPCCASLAVVRARGDFISRCCWQGRVDHYVECGHMGYLEAPGTRELFVRFFEKAVSGAANTLLHT